MPDKKLFDNVYYREYYQKNQEWNLPHQKTIKVVYPKYYLKEIVDMFCEFHSRENIIKDIEAGNTYILVENEEIIGTGTKNGNHITRVYVLPRYQKRGYGTYIIVAPLSA